MLCVQMTLVDSYATTSTTILSGLQSNTASNHFLCMCPSSWQLTRRFRCILLLPFLNFLLAQTRINNLKVGPHSPFVHFITARRIKCNSVLLGLVDQWFYLKDVKLKANLIRWWGHWWCWSCSRGVFKEERNRELCRVCILLWTNARMQSHNIVNVP